MKLVSGCSRRSSRRDCTPRGCTSKYKVDEIMVSGKKIGHRSRKGRGEKKDRNEKKKKFRRIEDRRYPGFHPSVSGISRNSTVLRQWDFHPIAEAGSIIEGRASRQGRRG